MKKIIASLVAVAAVVLPAHSDPLKDNEYYTMHSMGCMLLQECTEDVKEIFSIDDVVNSHPDIDYDIIADEFYRMLSALNKIGVKVFLADEKYFPSNHRGVYHTVGNNFFLNKTFMDSPHVLMSVMRHEGWHAAQDCMAGTINNNVIAIIKPEEDVPMIWRELVARTYPEYARPWEAEATWAGKTKGMTADALAACATGAMWEVYEPTPLTREYLVKEGFLSK